MRRLTKSYQIGNNSIRARYSHLFEEVSPHFQEYYEIEYVLSGKGHYTFNGNIFPFEEGLLSFLTPLDYHGHHTQDADLINIMFDTNFVKQQYLEPFLYLTTSKVIKIDPQQNSFLLSLLKEIVEFQQDTEYCTKLIECALLKFSQILPNTSPITTNHAISKMHYYILKNYQKNISLESAAAYAGLSSHYASALFKKEMNMNFKTYVNTLRYSHAKKLLLSTNETVSSICVDSGFEDVPNFVRRFKEQFGMTPSQFRKNPR